MNKIIRTTLFLIALGALGALVTGCGSTDKEEAEDQKAFQIGCMPLNEPAVQAVAEMVKEKGYDMEVVVFDGNNLPAIALKDGSIDGLMLNHLPWINTFNQQNGSELVMVKPYMYASIFGIYSSKHDSIADIPNGGTITISNDPDNMQRSLKLLEQEGLIKLGEKKGQFYTTLDIAENKKNLKFSEVETTATAASYKDVDATIAFSSVMKNAGIDAFSYLADDGQSVNYPTGLVVNKGNEDKAWVKAVLEVTQSAEFKKKFDEIFKGAYVMFSELEKK